MWLQLMNHCQKLPGQKNQNVRFNSKRGKFPKTTTTTKKTNPGERNEGSHTCQKH